MMATTRIKEQQQQPLKWGEWELMEGCGDPLERGESVPLLDKDSSLIPIEDDSPSEKNQGPLSQHKPSNWKAPTIILGIEYLQNMAYSGVSRNLVVYLRTVLHGSNASNAANVTTWGGTCYFTPLIGALLADVHWGRYMTIVVSSLIYLLGLVVMTISALSPSLRPPPCIGSSCIPATEAQNLVFFSGLYLVAIGYGGIKSTLLPFGAEQFDDEKPAERKKKSSYFNWFYVCMTFGTLIAGTLVVWIEENISWRLGYVIATSCMVLALSGFVFGRRTYQSRMRSGSPLKSVLQVLIASFRKMKLEVATDCSLLYEVTDKKPVNLGQQRLVHTEGFRFLDKAAMITDSDMKGGGLNTSWTLCTITQVEESKILLRLLPLWFTGALYSVAYAQMFTTFVQQGSAMNTRISSFSVPPASLSSFEAINALTWVLIYSKIIDPIVRNRTGNGVGLSQLQRIGIGHFLMILTMATAALVEGRRLDGVKTGKVLSIAWQVPQYFILSGSEVFHYIGQLEFSYGQASGSMKSLCTAFALLTIATGKYLSSLIVMLVASITTAGGQAGWVPDDLNEGHLDYFFWLLAALCTLNFGIYLAVARNYTLNKVAVGQ